MIFVHCVFPLSFFDLFSSSLEVDIECECGIHNAVLISGGVFIGNGDFVDAAESNSQRGRVSVGRNDGKDHFRVGQKLHQESGAETAAGLFRPFPPRQPASHFAAGEDAGARSGQKNHRRRSARASVPRTGELDRRVNR